MFSIQQHKIFAKPQFNLFKTNFLLTFINKKFNSGKCLELVLTYDIIYFIMGIAAFITTSHYSHYEELKL